MLAALGRVAFEALGQATADLVEHQPHQRFGPGDVRWRDDQVEGHRDWGVDEVGDPPVAGAGGQGDGRIAIEAQERHRRGEDPAALVLGLIEDLARRAGDDGVNLGRVRRAQMVGGHHPPQGVGERALRIGEEGGDPSEGLFLFGVEDVKDGPDQQAVAGFFPMRPALQSAFRVDEHVGDILNVADFVGSFADLQQRIVASRPRVGRVEQQAVRERRAPAGGQGPVLTLDVVDDGAAGPRQQGRDDQAHALARSGRGEGHHMLGAGMAQVAASQLAEEHTFRPEQSGGRHFTAAGPARRSVGGDLAGLTRPPQRAGDRAGAAEKSAGAGQQAGLVEDRRRIGLVVEPPVEELPGAIERLAERRRPGRAQLDLVVEHRRCPLGRGPDAQHHDREDRENLADEELGGRHAPGPEPCAAACGSGPGEAQAAPRNRLWRLGPR